MEGTFFVDCGDLQRSSPTCACAGICFYIFLGWIGAVLSHVCLCASSLVSVEDMSLEIMSMVLLSVCVFSYSIHILIEIYS